MEQLDHKDIQILFKWVEQNQVLKEIIPPSSLIIF